MDIVEQVFAPLKMWIAPSCSVQVCEWPFSVRSPSISLGIERRRHRKGPENTAMPHKPIAILPEKAWKKKIANRDRNSVIQLKSLNKWRDKALVEILKIRKCFDKGGSQ